MAYLERQRMEIGIRHCCLRGTGWTSLHRLVDGYAIPRLGIPIVWRSSRVPNDDALKRHHGV
jgi:hypothetical protein